MEFLSLSRRRYNSSSQNVSGGEERGETAFEVFCKASYMMTKVYQVYHSAVPAREVLYLRWILEHKIVGKVHFEIPEGVLTKARVPSKICNHGNHG